MNKKSLTEYSPSLTRSEVRELPPIIKREYQLDRKNTKQRIRRAKAKEAKNKMNSNDNNGPPAAMASPNRAVMRTVHNQTPTTSSRVALAGTNNNGGTVSLLIRVQLFCQPFCKRLRLTPFCFSSPLIENSNVDVDYSFPGIPSHTICSFALCAYH